MEKYETKLGIARSLVADQERLVSVHNETICVLQ